MAVLIDLESLVNVGKNWIWWIRLGPGGSTPKEYNFRGEVEAQSAYESGCVIIVVREAEQPRRRQEWPQGDEIEMELTAGRVLLE